MKKNIYTVLVLVVSVLMSATVMGQRAPVTDSLSMSPGYSMDIFYSMANGQVSTVERANWDIGFYTPRFSAGIIVNDGSGAMLYTYPNGDTNAWSNIDTTGMMTWKQMYNSSEIWEDGAFNENAKGHPDYGWGWYNMADHSVYGDSIYIIHYPGPDGWTKKLWIKKKISAENIYIFTHADIDGANQHDVELNVVPYETKRFIYYSLENNEELDREPENESWDILFTKYVDLVTDLEGNLSPYLVTGATLNVDIGANNFYPVAPDFDDWSSKPLDSLKNKIGYDWKSFDMGTFSWKITDSNYYFIQDTAGAVHKLKFLNWSGSSSGDFVLMKEIIAATSIFESSSEQLAFDVFPNPAGSQFTIKLNEKITGSSIVNIYDQSGRSMYQAEVESTELNNGFQLNHLNLPDGLYIISINGNGYSGNSKLMIR